MRFMNMFIILPGSRLNAADILLDSERSISNISLNHITKNSDRWSKLTPSFLLGSRDREVERLVKVE